MENGTIMAILYFVGAMIPIFAIVVKVNSTLTKLNTTMTYVIADREEDKAELKKTNEKVQDHEIRIVVLEKQGGN